jgi:preprotein translocase subunit YajC
MKMFTLLQTNEVVEEVVVAQEGAAQTYTERDHAQGGNEADATAQGQQKTGGGMSMWIMLALIFGVMWFFMIRPQGKQQKEPQKFRDGLKKGDKVVTIGGIYGTITESKDASVLVEVDNGVKIRVSKQALIKDFSESQQ